MLNTKTSHLFFLNKINKKLFKNKLINRDKPQTIIDNRAYGLKAIESYSLTKNIRNLEFINHLEMSFKDKKLINMPIEFFTELEQLKQHSQINLLTTLHSINKLQ